MKHETRVFGGKRYRFHAIRLHKHEAQEVANAVRRKGGLARVVKNEGLKRGKIVCDYLIYVRD